METTTKTPARTAGDRVGSKEHDEERNPIEIPSGTKINKQFAQALAKCYAYILSDEWGKQ